MASTWLLVVGAEPYFDGEQTYPPGACYGRIIYDGVSAYTPAPGLTLVADDGRAVYIAPEPPPTTCPALTFINRLTLAEQSAIATADPAWGMKVAAAGVIDVTSPLVVSDVAMAVAAGLLTQARATQILDLAVESP